MFLTHPTLSLAVKNKLTFMAESLKQAAEITPEYKRGDTTSAVVIETFCPPEEMLSILKRCAFGVGMRLHFLIFLAILNKPMLPYLYDPKVKTFSEMLSLEFSLNKTKTLAEMEAIFASFTGTLAHKTNYSEIVQSLKDLNRLNREDLALFCQNL